MHSHSGRIVILGTGGTIAGQAADAADNVGYRAGAITVETLVAAIPALAGQAISCEQLANVDSKDMSHALWQQLAQRIAVHLQAAEVAAVVVTHGTDTLEETAYLLHQVLAPHKPVVLTAAMRPATSLQADGPQNLLDALAVARTPGAAGVLVAIAGQVFEAEGLRKVHGYRLDAFAAGEGGPLAVVEEGQVRALRPWPMAEGQGLDLIAGDVAGWPRVAWLTSHAGFDPAAVDALVAAGFDGLVVAGTGNGSLHAALLAALQRAAASGVAIRLTSRCPTGRIVGDAAFAVSPAASPAQARVALLLELLAHRAR